MATQTFHEILWRWTMVQFMQYVNTTSKSFCTVPPKMCGNGRCVLHSLHCMSQTKNGRTMTSSYKSSHNKLYFSGNCRNCYSWRVSVAVHLQSQASTHLLLNYSTMNRLASDTWQTNNALHSFFVHLIQYLASLIPKQLFQICKILLLSMPLFLMTFKLYLYNDRLKAIVSLHDFLPDNAMYNQNNYTCSTNVVQF